MADHEDYLDLVLARLAEVRKREDNAIREAARYCAEAIGGGGVVWVFGAGHSAMMALEAYPRMGGVLGFVPMVELSLLYFTNVVGSGGLEQAIFLERAEGFAEAILRSNDPREGDVIIIYSSSGVEVLPKELATGARARGLKVIGVTSLEYSRYASNLRNVGRTLADEVDLVIDNAVPPGDAVLTIDGVPAPVGPSSTMLSIAVMNSIAVDTAANLARAGITPEVFSSPHFHSSTSASYGRALRQFRRLLQRPEATEAD